MWQVIVGVIRTLLRDGRGPEIELRDLRFTYPDEPGRLVLDGLAATIPTGAVVGLFGRTGSGKSTLLRLLARIYNPPSGSIFIDGVDLTTLDLESWRRRLAVVPQRPFLFSDAIESNVALEEDPDDRLVRRAIGMSALEADLEVLPDGLETVVGERGIMLSGGQRQRVALARGLYRGGDLLILDDVLSAVDHYTEAQLVETVAGLARRQEAPTVIISSHRLSALRHCDQVLVLDGGRLVDRGPHDELVKRPGLYRDTWMVQSQRAPAEVSIPKDQLTVLSYTERRGKWRAIGTPIGLAGGAVPAALVLAIAENEGGQNEATGGIAAAAIGGGTAVGYLAGHIADTHTTTVVIAKN